MAFNLQNYRHQSYKMEHGSKVKDFLSTSSQRYFNMTKITMCVHKVRVARHTLALR